MYVSLTIVSSLLVLLLAMLLCMTTSATIGYRVEQALHCVYCFLLLLVASVTRELLQDSKEHTHTHACAVNCIV